MQMPFINKKYLIIEFAFFVILSFPQILKVVSKNEILDWIKTIAFYLCKYILTENWLVPFIVGLFVNVYNERRPSIK